MPRIVTGSCRAERVHVGVGAWLGALLLLLGLSSAFAQIARAQDAPGPVYVVQVQGDIDLGLAPYLVRVLDDAEREGATAVVVEINTPGGRLDAALQMRQALLDSPVRTIAWVNRDAFSAGALIALAANEVYMAPGAVIGAATPVTAGGQAADPKTVSAVRSTFRSTAELRGRDPQLAEAMVDPSIAIDGLVTSGQLLTLTTTDARAWGYADAVVADRQTLLQTAGLAGAAVRDTQPALAERLVRIVTHPLVASLLMTVGLLLILADVFGGGGGVPSVVGAGLMAFFFWGHMLAGLAGWEGVVLVGLGVALLAVEAFVIPGFGVAGVLGIAAFAGGLFISLIGGEIVTSADLVRAATTVGLTLLGLIGGGIGLAWLLVRTRNTGGLVLQARLGVSDGKTRPDELKEQRSAPVAVDGVADLRDWGQPVDSGSMLGARGVATSDLRPGGIARFAGERVDVITRGELLPAGTPLEIIRDDGYRRVVRRCEPAQGGAYRPTSTSRA